MKRYSLVVFVVLTHFSWAQQTTAKLEKVTEKNFYRIRVSPEIRSASQSGLGDVRIFDRKKNEVPYLIHTTPQKTEVSQFEAFTMVSKTSVTKKFSSVVVENPKDKINALTLRIANSDVVKKLNISGSNDQKQWFGIANKMELSNLNDTNSTQVSTTISFPLCSYKFLKIEVDDTKTLPINVLQVGTTNSSVQVGKLEEIQIKDRFIIQLPKEKKTQHHIILTQPQTLEKLAFKVKEPKLFSRQVALYTVENTTVNGKTTSTKEVISTFTLSSDSTNEFDIQSRKITDFYIEIANEDNLKLEIKSIQLFQKPLFLLAELNPNEEYTVVTGNAKLDAPSYDLVYFENEMKNGTKEIKMTDVKQQNTTKKPVAEKSIWQQPWFMWLCIVVGGITILYFSIGLAKDLKNN
jgi:hypothetical protein